VFRPSLCFIGLFLGWTTVVAPASTPTPVLVELFTSEGCSDCPAADLLLDKLVSTQPVTGADIIALEQHVDYWDRLGWRDPFASKLWTERQAHYSARWKTESVYTPAFVLDGKEWHYGKLPEAAAETPGVLKLTVNGERVSALFTTALGSADRYDIHIARLGFSLRTNVTAGENNGRKLVHDFVVLGLTNETMTTGAKELQVPVSSTKTTADSRTAIAAWITAPGQLEPIQAVGGWLP
jgi:hypothetical protein